jgi:hypothetical protein
MGFVCGVYGYTFTRPFDVGDMSFEPLYQTPTQAVKMARDKDSFRLTGVLQVPVNSLFAFRARRDTFFDLEAALTFCEQQHVALSNCAEVLPGEDAVKILRSEAPDQLKQDIDSCH